MLIFWKERLVFLSTPKTGSTSIETALESLAHVAIRRPPELKHMPAHDFRTSYGPYLEARAGEKFTTIALMREPIGWLRSWYRFRLRDDEEDPSHAMIGLSFADFAQAYADPAGPDIARVGAQADFLTAEADRVDRIFRYEDMDAFTHFLEDRLDCAISLPRVNVPPAVDVSLQAEQEGLLRKVMARDFALYDTL